MVATKRTRTPRKTTAVIVEKEPIQMEVATEVLPVVEVAEPVQEPILMLESPQPMKIKYFILRHLPENAGKPHQVRKAWKDAIAELDALIKGQGLQYGITSRPVDGVEVQFILAEETLISYLAKNHPGYIEGGCPEYKIVQT